MRFKTWFFLAFFQMGMAAGPMMHLFLGEKYCSVSGDSEERTGEFLVGTLYPDIRYVAHFPRELTHPLVSNLEEVKKCTSSFERGIQFHAWVDIVREEFVEKSGIYRTVTPYAHGHKATLLKFIEEEVLASFYDGRKWNFLFDQKLENERVFATDDQIEKWHTMIQYCMAYRPSWLIWGVSYFKSQAFGISDETLYEWSYLLPELAQEPIFQLHVKNLLAYLLEKMEEPLSK